MKDKYGGGVCEVGEVAGPEYSNVNNRPNVTAFSGSKDKRQNTGDALKNGQVIVTRQSN